MNALLRHEWNRTRRMLGAIGLGAVLLTAAGCLASLVPVDAIRAIGMLAVVLGVMGVLVGMQIALTGDYWKSAYGRMGYFTHTLPVSGARIYGARILYAGVVLLAGTVLTVLLALVAAWSLMSSDGVDAAAAFSETWNEVVDGYGVWPLVFVFLVVWLSAVGYLVYFYFSVSVGHEPWLARLGWGGPVVVAMVTYLLFQLFMAVAMVAVPLGLTTDGGTSLRLIAVDMFGAMRSGSDVDAFPLGALLGPLVAVGAMVARTAWSWNHRVSLR